MSLSAHAFPPDYRGGGIANLMASLCEGMGGGATGYPTATLLPPQRLADRDKIVLCILDGVGYDRLRETPGATLLNRALAGPLTSVCPPTTASAIPTFLTGVPPQQHGFTGWFTWFRELGSLLAVLPFVQRGSGASAGQTGISPAQLCGVPPLFDRLQRPSRLVMPGWINDSLFNRAFLGSAVTTPYRDLDGFVATLAEQLRIPGPAYIHAYWPGYDAIAHQYGLGSREATHHHHLLLLDRALERLLPVIEQARATFIVTADHGFIDSPPERTLLLSDHPVLAECLMMPLSGEPRLSYAYVRPERREPFERYVRDRLGEYCDLLTGPELIERGWFGLGAPHPHLATRVGHYALVMKGNYKLKDWIPGEQPYVHLGVHGGMSGAEMRVPLVLLEGGE